MNAVCGPSKAREVSLWVSGWTGTGPPRVTLSEEGGREVRFSTRWVPLKHAPGSGESVGILTLWDLQPGLKYRAMIQEPGGEQLELRPKTLPEELPKEGITFLLASCYYRRRDEGEVIAALRDLRDPPSPLFKLLVGDQIYADFPSLGLLPFRNIYAEYWNFGPYREFLSDSPNFFTCDDHEWWNNAPEFQFYIPPTWLKGQREQSFQDGREAYGLYQVRPNAQGGFWYTIDIPPVSIFVADNRAQRTYHKANPHTTMSAQQAQALAKWARNLVGPGFLVLGQPFFGKEGDWKDYNLPDFEDEYRLLWDTVEMARHRITVLTGDIHVGRLALSPGVSGVENRPPVYEFTCSPLALVPGGGQSGLPAPATVTTKGGLPRGYGRDVMTVFGTHDPNFGLVRLVPIPGQASKVRADFVLWSIPRKRVALDQTTGKECWLRDLILE